MKKKVSIYFRNHLINPSNYYRIYQYLDSSLIDFSIHDSAPTGIYYFSLNSSNSMVRLLMKLILYPIMSINVVVSLLNDIFRKPDYILIQREIMPKYILLIQTILIKKCANISRIIWDYDDDIFESNEISKRERKILERESYKIVVINEYLKNLLPEGNRDKVICMPTTDGQIYKKITNADVNYKAKTLSQEVNLVWVGTSNGLRYVKNILPALEKSSECLKTKGIKLRLYCISGTKLVWSSKYLEIVNVKWSRQNLIKILKKSHFGIMPLLYENYSFGKGGFKLLQYMSARIPVLGSSIGFNKEIIQDSFGILIDDRVNINNWSDAIQVICQKNYYDLSRNAYETWLTEYSFDNNKAVWNNLLNE